MPSVIIGVPGLPGPLPPFGEMTNQICAALYRANQALDRLSNAVAAAASGYDGVPGTEYEGPNTNFGVVGDPNNPGKAGSDYAYAVNTLAQQWASFWQQAASAVHALDNGDYLGP